MAWVPDPNDPTKRITTEELNDRAAQDDWGPLDPLVDMLSGEEVKTYPIDPVTSTYQGPRDAMVTKGSEARGTLTNVGTGIRDQSNVYAGQAQDAGRAITGAAERGAAKTDSFVSAASGRMQATPGSYADPNVTGNVANLGTRAAGFTPSTGGTISELSGYRAPDLSGTGVRDARTGLTSLVNQNVPSAAQAQLQQGMEANVAAQLALAQSGRGAGSGAQAQRVAAANAAAIGSRTATEAAQLRAQEAQAKRAQDIQALAQAGELGLGEGSQALDASGQRLEALRAAGTLGQGADALGLDALRASGDLYLGAGQYGLSAREAADQAAMAWYDRAYGGTRDAADLRLRGAEGTRAGVLDAASIYGQGAGQYLDATASGFDAERAYLDSYFGTYESEADRRTRLAEAELDADVRAQEANQRADSDRDSSVTGMIGGLLGAAGLFSDRRAKKNVRICDLVHGGK